MASGRVSGLAGAGTNSRVVIAQLLIPQGGATCDGNRRKELCPICAPHLATFAHKRDFLWAHVLVSYIGGPNKNKKPANISQVGCLRQNGPALRLITRYTALEHPPLVEFELVAVAHKE